MNQSKRQTGRTTRMLEHAVELSKQGKVVYVMAFCHEYAKDLRRKLDEMTNRAPHGIKVETPKTMENFDLLTMRLRNAHPNCEVLVDHHTIEVEYAAMIGMLTRYDSPIANA